MKQFIQYLPSTTEGKTLRVSLVKEAGKPMYIHVNEGVAEYRDGIVFSFETKIPDDYTLRVNAPFDWTCTKRNRAKLWIQVQTLLIEAKKMGENEFIYLV